MVDIICKISLSISIYLFNFILKKRTHHVWEGNQAHPTSDVFVALCDIYKINNVSDVFMNNAKESKSFPITAEERQIIEHYRSSPELQGVIRKILNIEN